MRVALLSNFWYRVGGLERVMLADAAGLSERGNEVAPFASAHPLNEPTPFAEYFPPNVDHGSLGRGLCVAGQAATAARLFSNRRAAAAFEPFAGPVLPAVGAPPRVSRQISPRALEPAPSLGIPPGS